MNGTVEELKINKQLKKYEYISDMAVQIENMYGKMWIVSGTKFN